MHAQFRQTSNKASQE